MGGVEKTVAKLDEMFATQPVRPAVVGENNDAGGLVERFGQIGQYWHGNEPSHHIIYLYSLFGRRDRASQIIRRICTECYRPTPDGLCGNDDCGQMSAWYLFSVLGFYPLNPCDDGYVIGQAQLDEIKLKVGDCEFRVINRGKGEGVFLNGKRLDGVKISHKDIMRGGTLVFGGDLL
jgi:putative alpha-1,2-mannosidase